MKRPLFKCTACGEEMDLGPVYLCPKCEGELTIIYDYYAIANKGTFARMWLERASIWERFECLLPAVKKETIVSLGEGNTPLVKSERLAKNLGVKELYFKLEGCNPTGSFKDRQISLALAKANEYGSTKFGTASSGNVGISLSAYTAKAGFDSYVWVSADTARSKIQQIQIYGAKLFLMPKTDPTNVNKLRGVFVGMQRFCLERGLTPMISARPVNPYMVEGSKTMSYEIVADLGNVPDKVFVPIGGGGVLGGIWKGFTELKAIRICDRLPVLFGGQRSDSHYTPIDRLGEPEYQGENSFDPLDAHWAWESLQESKGAYAGVSNKEIREAQKILALKEGIFAEPQGAQAAACLLKAGQQGQLAKEDIIVCLVTGMGLKDMQAAEKIIDRFPEYTAAQHVTSLEDSDLDN